ncbi:FAD/NAD(P)-binding domain-containing protein [Thozetella sp. PMI_491]|nr:FAD/NAD(P)-binding domain-containing protein [Thozetella sp. PMI_491]
MRRIPYKPKIVIVGGSVTGLTLANILERLGIDYILLEGHEQVAPQLGASIAFWSNGFRILDQLGCFEDFVKDCTLPEIGNLMVKGKLLTSLPGFASQHIRRHGYGMFFNDRKAILETLYTKLQDKSKVLANKRVVRLETTKSGVRAHTQDGEAFEGDMLIGGDGVYSTVRKEMWRIAEETKPGYFDKTEPGRPNSRGHSYLVSNGPGGRIYWFLFAKLDEILFYDNTPRYTESDKQEMYRDVTFGDLVDTVMFSTLTPLHEWIWEKWHFGRIMTLGDAAHKVNPLPGQGGNGCIEDAAELVNQLTAKLDSNRGPLTAEDITDIFAQTQAVRAPRMKLAMDLAIKALHFESLQPRGVELLVKTMLPILGRDVRMERQSSVILGARPHFDASLPRWITGLTMVVLSNVASHALRLPEYPPNLLFRGVPFKTKYTGFAGLDGLFTLLVKFFGPLVAGDDPAKLIQAAYLIASLMPMLVILTVESRRRGNAQGLNTRLVTWPSVWATLYQLLGIARIGPIYYLVSLWTTNHPIYQRTSGRPVEVATARAILPGAIFACVIPSVIMFLPFENLEVWQNSIAFWQVSPLLVSPLVSLLAALNRFLSRKLRDPASLYELTNEDVPHLLSAYSTAFCVAAIAHVSLLFFIASSPTLSLARTFWDVAFTFLKYDLMIFSSASMVWCLYSVFEVRRQGYITTPQAWRAALGVLASAVLLGPGAAYAGTWYWRESVIATLSQRKSYLYLKNTPQ